MMLKGLDAVRAHINAQLPPEAALSYDQVWRLTIRAVHPLAVVVCGREAYIEAATVDAFIATDVALMRLATLARQSRRSRQSQLSRK